MDPATCCLWWMARAVKQRHNILHRGMEIWWPVPLQSECIFPACNNASATLVAQCCACVACEDCRTRRSSDITSFGNQIHVRQGWYKHAAYSTSSLYVCISTYVCMDQLCANTLMNICSLQCYVYSHGSVDLWTLTPRAAYERTFPSYKLGLPCENNLCGHVVRPPCNKENGKTCWRQLLRIACRIHIHKLAVLAHGA